MSYLANKNWLPEATSAHLNAVRGISALFVVLNHMRGLFFSNYEMTTRSLGIKFYYFISSLGHQSVVVFFVLSGFFIGSKAIVDCQDGSWSWRIYLSSRLARLYIVVIPGLFLTLFWDQLGLLISQTGSVYFNKPDFGNIIAFEVNDYSNIKNFFGNLCYLQTIRTGWFGSNTPLWSLAYEFWYYILFPLAVQLWISVKNAKTNKNTIVLVLCICSVVFIVDQKVILYFFIWLMGTAVSIVFFTNSAKFFQIKLVKVIFLMQFVAVLVGTRFQKVGTDYVNDILLGFSFSLFVIGLYQTTTKLPKIYAHISKWVADFSFSLYVLHLPMLVFINAMFFTYTNFNIRWTPDTLHLSIGMGIVGVVILYSYGISMLTEANTQKLRDLMIKVLDRKSSSLK